MATEWQDRPQRHSVLACCAADLCLIQTWSRRAMEREMMEDDSSDDDRIHGKRAQGLAQENPPEDKFCASDETSLYKQVVRSQKSHRSVGRSRNLPFPPGLLLQALQPNIVYDPATDMMRLPNNGEGGPRLVACTQQ
mmetsp:Transcript_16009/g.36560  ORF Transcript_16009/g.36560 Transcript_16009/m.36560 type:complete len:137 (+) Transcript_16009:2007-2417(+)